MVERLAALPARPEPLASGEERAMLAEMRGEARAAVDELRRPGARGATRSRRSWGWAAGPTAT